ncbi:MAG: radical SAM protein [Oligoflexia bacterium]|nr:radical SAM protein [Oligoflexia bacterium]
MNDTLGLNAQFFITKNCNLKCSYCFESTSPCSRDTLNKTDMSIETFSKAITFIASKFNRSRFDYINVFFLGGEVLLKVNNLIEMATIVDEVASKFKIKMIKTITTNGTLLSRNTFDKLCEREIKFAISLDGEKEEHDYNRKLPSGAGSYDLIWRNGDVLKDAIDKKICTCVLMTINKKTLNNIYKNIVHLIDSGFTNIKLNFATEEMSPLLLDDNWNHISSSLRDAFCYAKKNNVHIYPLDLVSNSIKNKTTFNQTELRCGVGSSIITVDSDGTIAPCAKFFDNNIELFTMGNALTGELKNEVFNFFTTLPKNKKLKCNSCEDQGNCVTYCPSLALKNSNLFCPPETMCKINKIIHQSLNTISEV